MVRQYLARSGITIFWMGVSLAGVEALEVFDFSGHISRSEVIAGNLTDQTPYPSQVLEVAACLLRDSFKKLKQNGL